MCQSKKRPFYNIAHRCNTIRAAEEAIANGANALEVDIVTTSAMMTSKNSKNLIFVMYHAFDFFKGKLIPQNTTAKDAPYYFHYLAQLLLDKKIAMILFDMKKPSDPSICPEEQAAYFMKTLEDYKIDTRYCVFTVSGQEKKAFHAFYSALGQCFNGGLDVYDPTYQNNNLYDWLQFLSDIQVNFVGLGKNHIMTRIFLLPWLPWIRALVEVRDGTMSDDKMVHPTSIKKVFFWTARTKAIMRVVLNYDMDGMIVDNSEDLARVLQEPCYKARFRYATQSDSLLDRFLR